MNEKDIVLQVLQPPAGGLERLRARRDFMQWAPWVPFALGCSFAVAVMIGGHHRFEMQMQLNGSRLINQKAQGEGIRLVDDAYRAETLPSGNPKVRIYWIEKKPVGSGIE